jgi:hypothetical protein
MVKFISDRVSYRTLSVGLCDNIVLNVHASTEDKSDGTKDTFLSNWSMYWISSRSTA